MKRGILVAIIILVSMNHVMAQQLGTIDFSRTADFERIILANGDIIDSSAYCSRINDDSANFLLIINFTTVEKTQKVVMPYPALLEAIDALGKMAHDKPFKSGQATKIYKYKEFSVGWMQLHDSLNWLITIENDQPLFIYAASFDELNNALLVIKKNMAAFMWDDI